MHTPVSPPAADTARVVTQGVVYMRAETKNDSEQVSQQLLGSLVNVVREENGWAWVQGDDTYRGWIDTRFLRHSPGVDSPDAPLRTITTIFAEVSKRPSSASPLVVRLPLLATLNAAPADADGWCNVLLPDGKTTGFLPETAFEPLAHVPVGQVAAHAALRGRDLLGTPYLWGGSSPFGIDCSGFVQLCYRLAGVLLRRDADIQRNDPRFYEVPLDDPHPGDLILFGSGPERITHIGMALADGTFIHSAGGSGVIISPVGDDRYWPKVVDARRLDPARATDAVVRVESDKQ